MYVAAAARPREPWRRLQAPARCRMLDAVNAAKQLPAMRLRYNAPVVLTFALLAILILMLNASIMPRLSPRYFALGSTVDWGSLADWFRLFSHPLGHASWTQLTGNLAFVLLLGPPWKHATAVAGCSC